MTKPPALAGTELSVKDLVQHLHHSSYTFSAVGQFHCLPMLQAYSPEHSVLCLDFLPLFTIDHPYPSPCPFVCFSQKLFHISQLKVVHPPSHSYILLILFNPFSVAHVIISMFGCVLPTTRTDKKLSPIRSVCHRAHFKIAARTDRPLFSVPPLMKNIRPDFSDTQAFCLPPVPQSLPHPAAASHPQSSPWPP